MSEKLLAGRVVTIDGPAGAGKSTVARGLAVRLGWRFLDTGAMYRAVALAALREQLDLGDEAALGELVGRLAVTIDGPVVRLDGEDVSALIRSPQVAQASSQVARCAAVRGRLVEWQRGFALAGDTVTEGRDQGTVVFPSAVYKVFLTASREERAGRRYAELVARGETMDREEVYRDQEERDQRDSRRAVGPLRPAADALIVDTTGLGIDEVIALIAGRIEPDAVDDPIGELATAWVPDRSRLVAVGRTVDDATRAAVLGPEGCVVAPPDRARRR